jgi:hypothetical protein
MLPAPNAVIASASKAIHLYACAVQQRKLDCFVARALLRKRFAFVAGNDVETVLRILAPQYWEDPTTTTMKEPKQRRT